MKTWSEATVGLPLARAKAMGLGLLVASSCVGVHARVQQQLEALPVRDLEPSERACLESAGDGGCLTVLIGSGLGPELRLREFTVTLAGRPADGTKILSATGSDPTEVIAKLSGFRISTEARVAVIRAEFEDAEGFRYRMATGLEVSADPRGVSELRLAYLNKGRLWLAPFNWDLGATWARRRLTMGAIEQAPTDGGSG